MIIVKAMPLRQGKYYLPPSFLVLILHLYDQVSVPFDASGDHLAVSSQMEK